MQLIWWGQQNYEKIQQLQKEKVVELAGQPQVEIWGLEFEPTVTLGLRARREQDLKICGDEQFQVLQTDRGGRATLHSPGQLVIFPMLDLKSYRIGVQNFVELLFRTTQSCLKKYSVESYWKTSEAGVYTSNGKIAFCGLKIDSGVVRHGLSINISNDLKLFDSLVPCGNSALSLDRLIDHCSDPASHGLVSPELFLQDWFECFSAEWKSVSFS